MQKYKKKMYLCIFNRKKYMTTITAVIITQNEERNIERCLNSLDGVADEVVVVDSGSTDRTEQICSRRGARFVSHAWEGYSGQKNFADGLATHPWTLSIDADEALSVGLRRSLLRLKRKGMAPDAVYAVNRLTNFCGRWINHCGWYPDRKVRLWPTGSARWEGDIHEEVRFEGERRTEVLEGDLLHFSYNEIDDLARRQPRYYRLAAAEAAAAGRRAGIADIMLKPLWTFVRDYVVRGGFRDGLAGFVVCRMNAHYTFMKYTTLREMQSCLQEERQGED